jgi:hypothetical protein
MHDEVTRSKPELCGSSALLGGKPSRLHESQFPVRRCIDRIL